ncbi:MAG: ABC transporter permease [Armatimonadetes bacterium]|nr:ABC transporter permease [Armatimonadota bacterium]
MTHRAYLIRRLLAIPPMLVGISLVLFLSINLAPGGPETFFVSEDMNLEIAAQVRERLGLNQPLHVRYLRWLSRVAVGDLGYSLTGGGLTVSTLVLERLSATLLLTGVSLVLAVSLAVLFGVISAVRQYSLLDKAVTVLAYFGMSFPTFWLGIMLILIFSVTLGWLPASGMSEYGLEHDLASRVSHLVLPVLALSAVDVGTFVRFVRASMLEVLRQDYVRTARAKGLVERAIVYRHALRNALIPTVTVVGLAARSLVAGAVFVETIFAWPGLGRLAVLSVYRRDYPVVMGVNIAVAVFVVVANLVVDLLYTLLDPRITYE